MNNDSLTPIDLRKSLNLPLCKEKMHLNVFECLKIANVFFSCMPKIDNKLMKKKTEQNGQTKIKSKGGLFL